MGIPYKKLNQITNKTKIHGFTIVELLIVIVIIAILATITIVVYNGIQEKAYAAKAASTADSFVKLATIYKINNEGNYPIPYWGGEGIACLGTYEDFPANNDFDEGQCMSFGGEGGFYIDEDFNDQLSESGVLPSGQLPTIDMGDFKIRGTIYQSFGETGGIITYFLKGNQACPKGMEQHDTSNYGEDVTLCGIFVGKAEFPSE